MRQISALEIGYQHAQINARIHDMPIGDAFKGPAYGEYEKSKGLGMVLGVVASVFTMGAALPMLAAGTMAMQIAGGVMLAGGVMTGVGAVTGNKKLMKTGGILSLAGGIGGWAANAAGVTGGMGSEALSKFAIEASGSIDAVLGTSLQQTAATAAANGVDAVLAQNTAAGLTDTIPLAQAASAAPAATQTAEQAATAAMQEAITPKSGLLQTELAGQGGQAGTIPIAGAQPTPPTAATTAPAGTGTTTTQAAGGAAAKPTGILGKFGVTGEEAKLLAEGVKGFASSGFEPDQQAYIDAATKRTGAETSLLTSQNALLEWQNANRQRQVVMISANDPEMETKMADAAKKGFPVGIIPVVGRPQPVPGTTPTTNAQTITANNPPPVFSATVPVAK